MPVKNFRELDAWRVAMDLALLIYEVIDTLPVNERFEMARYRHHVRIALGSVAEMTTCIELGGRLGYWGMPTVDRMNGELVRMTQLLHGVLRSIRFQIAAEAGTLLLLIGACLLVL